MNKKLLAVGILVVIIVVAILFILLKSSPTNSTPQTASSTQTLGGSLYENVSQNPAQNMPNTNPLSGSAINPFQKSPKNPFQ